MSSSSSPSMALSSAYAHSHFLLVNLPRRTLLRFGPAICSVASFSSSSRLVLQSPVFRPPRRANLPVTTPLRRVAMASAATPNLGLTSPAELPVPEISFSATEVDDVLQYSGDILAVGVAENEAARGSDGGFENTFLRFLDGRVGGILAEVAAEEDFSGKPSQAVLLRVSGRAAFKRVGLFGLGKNGLAKSFKGFSEGLASAAKTAQASRAGVALAGSNDLAPQVKLEALSSIASGVILGAHEDNRYKTESKPNTLRFVDFIGLGSGNEVEKRFRLAQNVSSGVIFSRHLVNSPANVLTPSALANEACNIASSYSDVLTAKILDEEECKELKMGSYLAVAAASANRPKFIHLCYKPPGGYVKTKLAIVGKGLTFDSGGYNIKTGPGCLIEVMKFDMGGAAATLGAAKAIAQIKPAGVEVHFIVAACENMISGTGMRPGDIVTASNGKTIEVNNTDAEGRLTLADALVYACNQGVEKIVDLATLTGACIIALGSEIAGVFTPSDELAQEIQKASEAAGEKLWRMPLEDSYWETMKSGIADMVNTGGRPGGSITAALFLKQYVEDNVKWLHIDMAGPVWNDKKKCATGFAVPTLVEWVSRNEA